MDDGDYPGSRWFWEHLSERGIERALAELWALRHWSGPCDEFWRLTEIARIEHGLRGCVPDELPEPGAELLAQVRASQAERLQAWQRGREGMYGRGKRHSYPGEENTK